MHTTPLEFEPAGQRHPHRRVRQQVSRHHAVEQGRELRGVLVIGPAPGELQVHLGVPVPPDAPYPLGSHRHGVCRQQALDAVEEGVLGGVVDAEQQESLQDGEILAPRDGGVLQDRLDLRREDHAGAALRVVQRLDAQAVARQEQLLVRRVPQREGEHAGEVGDHLLAPLLVTAQDHLGVGVIGRESVPLGLQLGAELGRVVDLAVVDECQATVVRVDGLVAAVDVDDRQAPHADGEVLVDLDAEPVRAAMDHGVEHSTQQLLVDTGETGDPAHRWPV